MSTASRRQDGFAIACSGEGAASAMWVMRSCRAGSPLDASLFVSGQSQNVSGHGCQVTTPACANASAPLIGANRALSSGRTFSADAKRLR